MQYGVKKYKTGGILLCAGCFYVYDKPVYSPLSQKDIIRFYRESWKFDLLNVDFDTNTRKKLQEEAAYCVPISAISVKRWDMPLQGSKPSN